VSNPLQERLAKALAASGNEKHQRLGLGQALASYLNWSDSDACPSPQVAAVYLDHLGQHQDRAVAQARFAKFQIAAGYAWGARETRHLAVTLRDARVIDKPARRSDRDRLEGLLGDLPDVFHAAFRRVITVNLTGSKTPPGVPHLSVARIEALLRSLAGWCAFRQPQDTRPTGQGFMAYAALLEEEGKAAVTIQSYLERIYSGYVIAFPGFWSLACRLVIDDWSARADREPARRNKTERVVGASTLEALGYEIIETARNAPFIGLHAARDFRNGLLLALGVSLPQRARALSWLAFDATLFLEGDFTIRIQLPGQAIKQREPKKRRKPYVRTFRNEALWRALEEYRAIYRPLYDDGNWLFPSQLSRTEGISEHQLGVLCGDLTERLLDVRVSIHDLRDNVATEASEEMENGGLIAPALLGHKDPKTTKAHYDHAEDVRVTKEFGAFIDAKRRPGEPLRL
jgi:integrase